MKADTEEGPAMWLCFLGAETMFTFYMAHERQMLVLGPPQKHPLFGGLSKEV